METSDLYALVSNTTRNALLKSTVTRSHGFMQDILAKDPTDVEAVVAMIEKQAPEFVRYGGKGWEA